MYEFNVPLVLSCCLCLQVGRLVSVLVVLPLRLKPFLVLGVESLLIEVDCTNHFAIPTVVEVQLRILPLQLVHTVLQSVGLLAVLNVEVIKEELENESMKNLLPLRFYLT